MTPAEAKIHARRAIRRRLIALDPAARARQQAALDEAFGGLPGLDRAAVVLLFAAALPGEYETSRMIRLALDLGKIVALPRVDWDADRLTLHRVDDPSTGIEIGRAGLAEPAGSADLVAPEEVDWVLVPGLGFRGDGHRLGRGRGHYDRLLGRLRPDAGRWALAFDEQWDDDLPVEPHDRPLDGIVSAGRRCRLR